jgi:hypothetical protein
LETRLLVGALSAVVCSCFGGFGLEGIVAITVFLAGYATAWASQEGLITRLFETLFRRD